MKNLYILFFTIILFLSSCISESEQNAAANAAALWGAEDYTITHSKLEGYDNDNPNALVITLKDLKLNDSDEKITSTSALTVFGMLAAEDYKDYDKIKIVIEKNKEDFEKVYDIKKLSICSPLLKNLLNLFRQDEDNHYTIPKEMIDEKLIRDSTLLQFTNILTRLDEDYGNLSGASVTGFSFDIIKNLDQDILIAWVKTKNGGMTTGYTFYFSLESKKIIYIGINPGG